MGGGGGVRDAGRCKYVSTFNSKWFQTHPFTLYKGISTFNSGWILFAMHTSIYIIQVLHTVTEL